MFIHHADENNEKMADNDAGVKDRRGGGGGRISWWVQPRLRVRLLPPRIPWRLPEVLPAAARRWPTGGGEELDPGRPLPSHSRSYHGAARAS